MLSLKGVSLGIGAAWAFCILIGGWLAGFGWGLDFVNIMSSFYIGYGAGLVGGIIGALWAFVDGAVFGLIFGLVYNFAASR